MAGDGALHRDSGVQSGSAGPETGEDSQVRSEESRQGFRLGTRTLSPTGCRPPAGAGTQHCQQRAESARSVRQPHAGLCAPAPCRLGFSPPLSRPRPRRREKAAQAQPRELEAWGLQGQGTKGM